MAKQITGNKYINNIRTEKNERNYGKKELDRRKMQIRTGIIKISKS